MKYEDIINKLEEAISLIDKIEMFISRIKPGDQVAPGLLYQIYESLILLREKLVEARLAVASH